MPALKLLETLKQSGVTMALVIDEYGDLDGLVTLHDILQALVGDIAGSPDEEHDRGDRFVAKMVHGWWLD